MQTFWPPHFELFYPYKMYDLYQAAGSNSISSINKQSFIHVYIDWKNFLVVSS